MSDKKVDTEIVRKQYTDDASFIDESEIIDVSVFDFDDIDSWLYIPTEYKGKPIIHDLYTWLKTEPELTFSANKKSIDTRTFTRSKKRSCKASFESILEPLSSPVSNTWRTSNFSNIEEDLSKYSDMSTANNKEEIVPPMLKMPSNTNVNLFADEPITSGQESMEVFLNMSHLKGIDSFINLMETGLSDPLMNVSQPSIFYSSITSLPRDDSLCNTECDKDEKASNMVHLYNQESKKYESLRNSDINETFLKNKESDNNKSYCLNIANKTFINEFETEKELNETYSANTTSTMVVVSNSDKNKSNITNLSSTYVNKIDNNIKKLESENNEEKESYNLNTTYPSASQKAEDLFILDTTYCTTNTEKAINNITSNDKNDMHYNKDQMYALERTIVHDSSKNMVEFPIPPTNSSFSLIHDDALNSMFKLPIPLCNQSTPKNTTMLNSTYRMNKKHLASFQMHNTVLNSTFKAPTLLRKELLAEIYKTGDHKLDCTFNHIVKEHQSEKPKKEFDEVPNQNAKNDIPIENKYNTYKKESSISKIKSCAEIPDETNVCKNSTDKKYYTFTKKGNNHGGKTDMENAESFDNVDTTFIKPFSKLQKRKQHIPRALSKLPQFLQKSNPNLVSNSLKTVNITGCTNASNFGYMKGSQPNIVRDIEKSVVNKFYSFGKMKSGSEQRLLELNTGVEELQILAGGGSTESIESTQSAHSAPDLDDRLSTCSDSSHNSYRTQPMNIEQLHQIVKMQEESLKQDVTSQLNRQVLENAWVDMKKDLPSPILKNNVNCDGDSPLSMDFSVKTSSPIISPTKSSQSNIGGHSTETVLKQSNEADMIKKVEAFNKPIVENKTRLRPPMNWKTGNRSSNLQSAIPRPPSRIPGPRFGRSTIKNIPGDIKKGDM